MGKRIGIGLFLVVFCAVSFSAWRVYEGGGPLARGGDFVVPRGNSETVARGLQRDGILESGSLARLFFRGAVYLTRRQGLVHAAEFAFPAHVSLREVLVILRHGRPVQHVVTIAEGLTAKQIGAVLEAAPFLVGDVPVFADGSVLPQTLSFVRGTTRASIVGRLQGLMRERLGEIWRGRVVDPAIGTPGALVVLASMVERETALPEERPLVARVFLNRLHLGMRLQSDPTVIYAVTDGVGRQEMPLTHEELGFSSPYNTYVQAGLPPGPICSPGVQALEAAAHPAAGDALYFVANGMGGHRFSSTLGEHNRNVGAYRALHGK